MFLPVCDTCHSEDREEEEYGCSIIIPHIPQTHIFNYLGLYVKVGSLIVGP